MLDAVGRKAGCWAEKGWAAARMRRAGSSEVYVMGLCCWRRRGLTLAAACGKACCDQRRLELAGGTVEGSSRFC